MVTKLRHSTPTSFPPTHFSAHYGLATIPTTLWKLSWHNHLQPPCCQTHWQLFRPHLLRFSRIWNRWQPLPVLLETILASMTPLSSERVFKLSLLCLAPKCWSWVSSLQGFLRVLTCSHGFMIHMMMSKCVSESMGHFPEPSHPLSVKLFSKCLLTPHLSHA